MKGWSVGEHWLIWYFLWVSVSQRNLYGCNFLELEAVGCMSQSIFLSSWYELNLFDVASTYLKVALCEWFCLITATLPLICNSYLNRVHRYTTTSCHGMTFTQHIYLHLPSYNFLTFFSIGLSNIKRWISVWYKTNTPCIMTTQQAQKRKKTNNNTCESIQKNNTTHHITSLRVGTFKKDTNFNKRPSF